MSTELRDWAEYLLCPTRLKEAGFLNSNLVRGKWDEHLSGKKNWQYHIWDVICFEAWRDEMGV